jgi:hypothetical protein
VEVSRKIKEDELERRPGAARLLGYLRELKQGKRVFDLNEVRARVMKQARARISYRRLAIDFADGEFTYVGVEE